MSIFTYDQALKRGGVKHEDVTSLGVPNAPTNQPPASIQAPAVAPQAPANGPIQNLVNGKPSFPADTTTSNPLPNIARTVGNIPSSAVGLAKAIVAPINPFDTENPMNIGANIAKSGSALVDIYKSKGALEGTKAILGGFADTYLKIGESIYGSLDKAYNALLDDPKKAISDATTHIAKIGVEDPLLVPTLLYGPKAATSDMAAVDLTKGATGAVEAATAKIAPVTERAGQMLKAAGEKTTGLGVSMSEPTKIALQNYQATQPSLVGRVKNFITGTEVGGVKPITEANTAVRKGLTGTEWQIGVQSKKVANDIWSSQIQPALEASTKTINKGDFLESVRQRIISENADLSRRNTLLNAFDSFAEDYKHVSNFTLPKLQEYKEGWAKFVPEKAYKGQPIAGALNEVRNMAAQDARQTIYNELGSNIKTAYLDYGNLQNIAEAGVKSVDPLRSKGVTRQVWEAVLDNAVTPVATFAGRVLYRTGEGLEFLGARGAKTVRDVISLPERKLPVTSLPSDYTNELPTIR